MTEALFLVAYLYALGAVVRCWIRLAWFLVRSIVAVGARDFRALKRASMAAR